MSKDMSGPPDTPDEEKELAQTQTDESADRPDDPVPGDPETVPVDFAGSTDSTDGETGKGKGTSEQGVDRRVAAVAAALVLACAGLVGYGVLNTGDELGERALPTAEVTYEVRGGRARPTSPTSPAARSGRPPSPRT
ncbi:hypothetical protein [Streptomyces verrucosisporus]|uniref:hypothetical protein n=1 Tax=Streptomyces verrucosisporus TaxID=1695161 RepID=UPI001F1284C4|nr:hypothetical protein [Streptomyces verrucosisporus]